MDDDDDGWQGVNAALNQFGLPAKPADRGAIIAALQEQIRLQGEEAGDHLVMRLLCGLLFSLGNVEDSLLVWRAKRCSFDTHCGIDVVLLCGAGLDETKAFLAAANTEDASAALEYIQECEACGDFTGFSVKGELAELARFYGVEPE